VARDLKEPLRTDARNLSPSRRSDDRAGTGNRQGKFSGVAQQAGSQALLSWIVPMIFLLHLGACSRDAPAAASAPHVDRSEQGEGLCREGHQVASPMSRASTRRRGAPGDRAFRRSRKSQSPWRAHAKSILSSVRPELAKPFWAPRWRARPESRSFNQRLRILSKVRGRGRGARARSLCSGENQCALQSSSSTSDALGRARGLCRIWRGGRKGADPQSAPQRTRRLSTRRSASFYWRRPIARRFWIPPPGAPVASTASFRRTGPTETGRRRSSRCI